MRGLKRNQYERQLKEAESHPTWVRGLKQPHFFICVRYDQSHPTWVRGLKQIRVIAMVWQRGVAPYVGAWIETNIPVVARCYLGRTLRGCVD